MVRKNKKSFKSKIISSGILLLLAFLLTVTTGYAWLVLSTSPEVTGVSTQVGANGSLEIALLNTNTRNNLYDIESNIGDSRVSAGITESNIAWGNIVDLSDEAYGLDKVMLYPSLLNVTNNIVSSTLLKIPAYGADGRIVELVDAYSGIYDLSNESFTFNENQDYGVRGIGNYVSESTHSQQLRTAKSNIKAAKDGSISVLTYQNGPALSKVMDNVVEQKMSSSESVVVTKEDFENVLTITSNYEIIFNNFERAIKNALIAYSCSLESTDDELLNKVTAINNLKLDEIETFVGNNGISFEGVDFSVLIDELNSLKASNQAIIDATNEIIESEEYTLSNFVKIEELMVDPDCVLVNGSKNIDENSILNDLLNGKKIIVGVTEEAGIVYDVTKLVGNYSFNISLSLGMNCTAEIETKEEYPYFNLLSTAANLVTAYSPEGTSITSSQNNGIASNYGYPVAYAIDLAFKTNAQSSNLLLQQEGIQRIYTDSTNGATVGEGSTVKFESLELNEDSTLGLIDAMRITFVDGNNNIVAMAKPSVSKFEIDDDGNYVCNLYLYDYSINSDGKITINGLPKSDNTIISLNQNVPTALTAIVWLDGNLVGNENLAAESAKSLVGSISLQFASSANLVPMSVSDMYSVSENIENIRETLEDAYAIYSATNNDNKYTLKSYARFEKAYLKAKDISDKVDILENTSITIIANANKELLDSTDSLILNDTSYAEEIINSLESTYGFKTEKKLLAKFVTKKAEIKIAKAGEVIYHDEIGGGYYKDIDGKVKIVENNYINDFEIYSYQAEVSEGAKETRYDKKYVFTIKGNLNDRYQEYLANYPAEARENFENSLVKLYELLSLKSSDESIMDAMEEYSLAYFDLLQNENCDYEPYLFNGSTFYRGGNTGWYTLTGSSFSRVYDEMTIYRLDKNAEKIELTEYKGLLRHDDEFGEFENYYYDNEHKQWYVLMDNLLSYEVDYTDITSDEQYNSTAVYEDYKETLFSKLNMSTFVDPEEEIEKAETPKYPVDEVLFTVEANHYYKKLTDSNLISQLNSAKPTFSLNIDDKVLLADEDGTKKTYEKFVEVNDIVISSTTEVIDHYSVKANSNSKFTVEDVYHTGENNVEIHDYANLTTVAAGEDAIIVEVYTKNGNKYTINKKITVVGLTKYEVNEVGVYYCGTDNFWYRDYSLDSVVTNSAIIEQLNAAK